MFGDSRASPLAEKKDAFRQRLPLFALLAVKRRSHVGHAAFLSRHPFPHCPWRIVAHLLRVSALEHRYPLLLRALEIPDNPPFHAHCLPPSGIASLT